MKTAQMVLGKCQCGDKAAKKYNSRGWCEQCYAELTEGIIPEFREPCACEKTHRVIGHRKDVGAEHDAAYHGGRFGSGEW